MNVLAQMLESVQAHRLVRSDKPISGNPGRKCFTKLLNAVFRERGIRFVLLHVCNKLFVQIPFQNQSNPAVAKGFKNIRDIRAKTPVWLAASSTTIMQRVWRIVKV